MARRAPLALLLLLPLPAVAAPDVECRGDLRLFPKRGVLKGRCLIRVRNAGKAPLRSLPLVLYPARFQALDPRVTDLNFDRYYLRWFRPGTMVLDSARSPGGEALTVRPQHEEADLPPGTVVSVTLPRPAAPGKWAGVVVTFTVRIPKRLGTFGRYGGRITLEAGALPFVPAPDRAGVRSPRAPPATARFDLRLSVERGEDGVQAGLLNDVATVQGVARLRGIGHSPFIAAGAELHTLEDVLGTPRLPRVRVIGHPAEKARARRLVRIAHRVAKYLREEWLPESARFPAVTLVEAPLRDRFVHVTDEIVMISDRVLEVFVLLQRFHELEVFRGVVLRVVRHQLRDLPLGADRDWLCEAIAWRITRAWVARQAGLKGKKLASLLDFFSFIPSIDRLYRAPRFTGSDLFYGRVYEPRDAAPDAFTRALSDRARGRVVAEKLRDKLGAKGLQRLIRGLLGSEPPVKGPRVRDAGDVRGMVEELYGKPLNGFFALWVGSRDVKQNLYFKEIETLKEHADGSETSRIVVAREGDERVGEVGEPVVVRGKDANKTPVEGRWDGHGMEGEIILRHDGGLLSPLRIDPAGRVYQTNTGDDVRPRFPFKILLNRFRIRVDLNRGKKNEAALGFTLHPNHSYRHAIQIDGEYAQDERALNLGYGIGFGKVIDQRSYGAGLGLRATAARLNEGVLQNDANIQETEGSLISFGAGLGFDTRIDRRNPTWGFKASAGVDFADTILGTDFRFIQYRAALGFVYSIVRGTQIAVEVEAGLTEGNRIPSQRQFDAGGEGSVRGVETGKFLGQARFVFRSEVRQMIFEDLNIPLLWLVWLRRVQGVIFIDVGDVGEDVRDVYEKRTDWKWGTGAGFRLYLDAFGIKNVTFRFDIAFRIDETDEMGPEYYLGVNQSF